jgi:hypothetical protein
MVFNPLNKFAGFKKDAHVQQQSATTSASTIQASNTSNNNSVLESGADSNKLNQRLKEMFKERITTFREAVYLLTGYKVSCLVAVKQVR